jgi:hypothetical protein
MFSYLPLFALALLLASFGIAELLADSGVTQCETDAKAMGGACHYGLRSIEDCYKINERASRAAVFAG